MGGPSKRALVAAVLAALLVVGRAPDPVPAAPTGKIVTQELIGGAGILVLFLKYLSAQSRIVGSTREADFLFDSPDLKAAAYLGGTCLGATDCTGAVPNSHTLRELRDRIIVEVHAAAAASAAPPPWRKMYEDYFACYGTIVFKAPDDAKAGAPAPAPAPAAEPAGCAALIADVVGGVKPDDPRYVRRLSPVDALNLSAALAKAPPILKQVSDENVGAFGADDAVRVTFLIRAGAKLLSKVNASRYYDPTPAAGAVAFDDLSTIYQKCATASPFDALACLTSVSSLEGKLETDRQQRVACAWAKSVWLPPYTGVMLSATDRRYWGAPPGC